MTDRYVFADEAGNFDFSLNKGATRYFVLCTVTMDDCTAGDDLLELRRQLGWKGLHLDSFFHASEDPQAVRDEVFDLLMASTFRVDATIFEKRKALPRLQIERPFYKLAWYLHFKHVAPRIASPADRLFVTAASLGTKKQRASLHVTVDEVVDQVAPCRAYRVAFWPMESDPCLQVADYCTWAIQRKWERTDTRSYDLIKDKLRSEFNVWAPGRTYHY